jgi:uncharacterized membrane protein
MERKSAIMDRILAVVFNTESKARAAQKTLRELEDEGRIVVYADALVAKKADGSTTVTQTHDPGPLGMALGTTLGAFIGLLGGLPGLAIGSAAGVVIGSLTDLDKVRVAADFIDDVSKELQPNRFAVVAEIQEDWTTPVDTRMEALGGFVFRRALSDVQHTADSADIAALKADLAQFRAEHAAARAERKVKLDEKIDQLESKIQVRLEKAKERREAAEQQAKAKVELLKARAAAVNANSTAPHHYDRKSHASGGS